MVELLEADGQAVDFVLCAGDDSTDELMFSSLNEKLVSAERTRPIPCAT